MIELKDFSFQYKAQSEPTLKNLNLSIYKGGKGPDCRAIWLLESQPLASDLNGIILISIRNQ